MKLQRRHALQWGAALPLAGRLPAARASAPPRLALLIGNRDYPQPDDLPPIHKNVRDLGAALSARGFEVQQLLDLDVQPMRDAVDAFARRVLAQPDCTVFFYFAGHGLQLEAENFLVGAGLSPRAAPGQLTRGSLKLSDDLVGRLPRRASGLTMAVIDACRTDLRAAVLGGDGFNQVEAPSGYLIAFSTGAGRPALAPIAEDQNTFYTAALVRQLREASGETSFQDLFRLVRLDVQRTMRNHPVGAVRALAQDPFIAENTRVRVPLALPETQASPAPSDAEAEADLQALDAALWPADVMRLAEAFLQRHPRHPLAASALVAREGARESADMLRRADVRLYRSAFDAVADEDRDEWRKAARGDKDAAARIARRNRGEADKRLKYEGWLQYAAALGNGIASYELALHYRQQDRPQLAAQYEARARDLGYTPPPTLDHYRK